MSVYLYIMAGLREQNKIIRNDTSNTLIIQGVAGSGKTSIALHRVAYLPDRTFLGSVQFGQIFPQVEFVLHYVFSFFGFSSSPSYPHSACNRHFPCPAWQVTIKNPFLVGCADGIFTFKPVLYYGQRNKCADLLSSYHCSSFLSSRFLAGGFGPRNWQQA